MTFDDLLQLNAGQYKETIIQCTTICNLHCEFCTNLTSVPVGDDSPNIWRNQIYNMDAYTLTLFCERFIGIGESNGHTLTGGEVTAMPLSQLRTIISILHAFKRTLYMRTNGYGLIKLGKDRVLLFDTIYLDNHSINAEIILECQEWLDTFFKGRVINERMPIHYNLEEARKHPHNHARCPLWMTTLSLNHSGVLHPCCNTQWIMVHNNDTQMENELASAGFSIHNPNIVNVLKNWRTTIPQYVRDECLYNCWKPDFRLGSPADITLKKNDRIRRD